MNAILSRLSSNDPLTRVNIDEDFDQSYQHASNSNIASIPSFAIPGSDPAGFLSQFVDVDSTNAGARIKLNHGTTTLAFRYKGGIMVCVDSRATAGR
jgi:20S proteasome subunit beta 5